MPIWKCSPAARKKLVIEIDAEKREEAIAKAKEIALKKDRREYDKWITERISPTYIPV